jgi:hypothetical protein
MASESNTILLIHGAWVTARSWDPFRGFYAHEGWEEVAEYAFSWAKKHVALRPSASSLEATA